MEKYRNPTPTVDIIIELPAPKGHIVLIRRKNPPHGYALPGGFVDEGEPLAVAARREALEETGLEIALTEQFFTYSAPHRDPRQHTVSTVFLATATGSPVAGDDAADVLVVDPAAAPQMAFDHGQILADYCAYRSHGVRPPVDR